MLSKLQAKFFRLNFFDKYHLLSLFSQITRVNSIYALWCVYEGHFGDIKENDNFRRFNCRTAEKVYKEFMLYAIGRNINKYHRFLHEEIKKFEEKTKEKTAQKKSVFENAVEGFLHPKIHTQKKKYKSPVEEQVSKTLITTGDSYFKIQSLKIGINRQPLFLFFGFTC